MKLHCILKFRSLQTVAASCALVAGLALGGLSEVRAADPITVGVIDEAKLGEGFKKYRDEVETLNKRANELNAQLDARELLSETEAKRFDELVDRKARTPAEETEFQNIIKSGADKRKNASELIGKAGRNATEEARLKELQGYMKTNANAVRVLEDKLFEQLRGIEQATDKRYIEQANEMVKKVAAEKKLTVVFRKQALVWFAPTVDITDAVLARLND